jgi:hypothetical protein
MFIVNEKKGAAVVEDENSSTAGSPERRVQANQLDGAATFLEDNRDLDTSHIDVTKLRHKIDFRVSLPKELSTGVKANNYADCTSNVCMLHYAVFG